jgi:hypothetical protein
MCTEDPLPRVFISYAHTEADTALARNLEKWLTAAGIEVWLDESRNWPGKNLDQAIPEAIEKCDAGVFLISRAWTERDWTHKELQLISRRDPSGNVIPRIGLFRAPRTELETVAPAELSRLVTSDWIDGAGPEAAAASLYCLCCGILKQEPGSRDTWVEKGLRLMNAGGGVAAPPAPRLHIRPVLPDQYPSLECGRANEFESVRQSYGERYHQVAVIAAPRGEAHERFKLRISSKISADPAPIICKVDWTPLPITRADYLERLVRALSDGTSLTVDDLPRLLREKLAHKNVILLHRTLESSDYYDPRLVDYYTRWLPEQVAQAQPNYCLKCIQPVEWNVAHGFRKLARSLGAGDWFSSEEEKDALRFMGKVLGTPSAVKPTKIPLSPVMEADVRQFCEIKQFSKADRDAILARTQRSASVRNSEDVLTAIDDYLLTVRAAGMAQGAMA